MQLRNFGLDQIARAALLGGLTFWLVIYGTMVVIGVLDVVHPLTGLIGSFLPHLAILGLLTAGLLRVLGARLQGRLALAISLIAAYPLDQWLLHCPPPSASHGPVIRVVEFNVYRENANGERIASAILATDADILIFEEAAPVFPFLPDLEKAYPHRLGCISSRACDLLILSKFEFHTAYILSAGPLSPDRVAKLDLVAAGISFSLIAAHITKPYFDDYGWGELRWLKELVRAGRPPILVAGDFNQAAWSPSMLRFISATGLRGYLLEPSTWPSDFGAVGIPIDHFLAGGGAQILSIAPMENSLGSNHRGIVATATLPSSKLVPKRAKVGSAPFQRRSWHDLRGRLSIEP